MTIHEATAVYVFTPAFDQLLFIRHRKPPLEGRWLPPGGHVDPGETPEQAALREVLEETGQTVELLDLAPEFPRAQSDRTRRIAQPLLVQLEDLGDHHHLDFVYVAVCPAPGPLRAEPGQPVAWFTEAQCHEEALLDDCRGHAAHLFEERDRYRAIYEAQTARVR